MRNRVIPAEAGIVTLRLPEKALAANWILIKNEDFPVGVHTRKEAITQNFSIECPIRVHAQLQLGPDGRETRILVCRYPSDRPERIANDFRTLGLRTNDLPEDNWFPAQFHGSDRNPEAGRQFSKRQAPVDTTSGGEPVPNNVSGLIVDDNKRLEEVGEAVAEIGLNAASSGFWAGVARIDLGQTSLRIDPAHAGYRVGPSCRAHSRVSKKLGRHTYQLM